MDPSSTIHALTPRSRSRGTSTTKPTTTTTTTPTPTFSRFDTKDIKLDSTGHAYLPFHPSTFGFPFATGFEMVDGCGASNTNMTTATMMTAAMTAMTAMSAMMTHPVPLLPPGGFDKECLREEEEDEQQQQQGQRMPSSGKMDRFSSGFFNEPGSVGSSSRMLNISTTTMMMTTTTDGMQAPVVVLEHINPLVLSLQAGGRLSEGEGRMGAARRRRGSGSSLASSASASASASSSRASSVLGSIMGDQGEEVTTTTTRGRSVGLLEGMRRTSEVEVEAALLPDDNDHDDGEGDERDERVNRPPDEDDGDQEEEDDDMKVVCDQVDETVMVIPVTKVRKRKVKDDVGGSRKKISLSKRKSMTANHDSTSSTMLNSTSSTSNPTSTSTSASLSHPDSAFSIPDPPRPFSFKDLGLSPPPPSLGDEGEVELGSSDAEEEDTGSRKTGKVGSRGVRVRGKRREMNRVAAKRHREKNKDRLKSLEKRKIWLDTALVEYEKSNKRLSETLERLKRENGMLKSTQVEA